MKLSRFGGHRAHIAAFVGAAVIAAAALAVSIGAGREAGDLTPGAAILRMTPSATASDAALERSLRDTATMARSDAVLAGVAEDPALPAQAPKWAARFQSNGKHDVLQAIADLRANTTARVIPGTSLLELSVEAPDEHESAVLTQMMTRRLLVWDQDARNARVTAELEQYQEGRKRDDDVRMALQQQIETIIQSHRVDFQDLDESPAARALATTQSRVTDTRTELIAANARVRHLRDQIAGFKDAAPPELAADLAAAQARAAELESTMMDLEKTRGELGQRLIDLRRAAEQIDRLKARLAQLPPTPQRPDLHAPRWQGVSLELVQEARHR